MELQDAGEEGVRMMSGWYVGQRGEREFDSLDDAIQFASELAMRRVREADAKMPDGRVANPQDYPVHVMRSEDGTVASTCYAGRGAQS